MTTEVIKEAVSAAKQIGAEQKLVQMLDAIQAGAVKVGETVVKYSPDVADAMLWVVRIDGLQTLIYGFMALSVLTTSSIFIFKWTKKANWIDGDRFCVGILFSAIFGSLSFICVVNSLMGVWNWVAVFEPKLWIAKQLVMQVIK